MGIKEKWFDIVHDIILHFTYLKAGKIQTYQSCFDSLLNAVTLLT